METVVEETTRPRKGAFRKEVLTKIENARREYKARRVAAFVASRALTGRLDIAAQVGWLHMPLAPGLSKSLGERNAAAARRAEELLNERGIEAELTHGYDDWDNPFYAFTIAPNVANAVREGIKRERLERRITKYVTRRAEHGAVDIPAKTSRLRPFPIDADDDIKSDRRGRHGAVMQAVQQNLADVGIEAQIVRVGDEEGYEYYFSVEHVAPTVPDQPPAPTPSAANPQA